MYEGEFAELYDQFYRGRGKDYEAEAATVVDVARSRAPQAASLLDVACGTGSHLEPLSRLLPDVQGLELSEAMIAVAAQRHPGLSIAQGDMRDFELGRRFDVVTCLFSSIGHLRDPAELESTLDCFARHLAPGGVVVVEPWWFPETFADGYVAADVVEAGERTIARMSHSVRRDDVTRIEIHWTIAEASAGIRHEKEQYEITLFERDAYEAAFRAAGLDVELLEGGPSGRGLFVGRRAAAA